MECLKPLKGEIIMCQQTEREDDGVNVVECPETVLSTAD